MTGEFGLSVRDDRGFIDNVQDASRDDNHSDAALTLAPGMSVMIRGTNGGRFFSADEIDAPNTSSNAYAPEYPQVYYENDAYPYWDYPTLGSGRRAVLRRLVRSRVGLRRLVRRRMGIRRAGPGLWARRRLERGRPRR